MKKNKQTQDTQDPGARGSTMGPKKTDLFLNYGKVIISATDNTCPAWTYWKYQ